MRKAIKLIFIMTVFLTTMLALAFTAGAGLGAFSAHPVRPENQEPVSSEAEFFDLRVTPGMTQEIVLEVRNFSEDPIFVEITMHTVGTNEAGIVDYVLPGLSDDSVPFRLEDVARLPDGADHVVIPGLATANVPIVLNIPNTSFEGITLGSFRVLLGIDEDEIAEGGMFVNRFSNTVPIRMQMNSDPVEPDFFLGDVSPSRFSIASNDPR